MEPVELVKVIADGLFAIDQGGTPYRHYQPGVGPYSETQIVRELASFLRENFPSQFGGAKTQRSPDLLLPHQWAIEFKLVRPYGDNGKEAEHWSQNLLHPYEGNTSLIGDIYKLSRLKGNERKLAVAVTFSHNPAKTDLTVIVAAFEALANMLRLPISERHSITVTDLQHPVHQQAAIYAWEVL